jgi:hypothetical protein
MREIFEIILIWNFSAAVTPPLKHKNRPSQVGYAIGSVRGQASKSIPAFIAPLIGQLYLIERTPLFIFYIPMPAITIINLIIPKL